MKKLLCVFCAALLWLPLCAMCEEQYETKTYTDEKGREVWEQYDQSGRLVARRRTYQESDCLIQESCTYDEDGREAFELLYYDDAGKLIYSTRGYRYTDADGKKVEEHYDENGRLTFRSCSYIDADGKEVTEYYDANGQLTRKSLTYFDADGKRIDEFYDADGKKVEEYDNKGGQ